MIRKFSYDEFWDKLQELNSKQLLENNEYLIPANRSSTIFPVFSDKEVTTKIHFLSYWLKKHGNNVVIRLIARKLSGEILNQYYKSFTTYKANTIEISNYFDERITGFCGSLEIEIFSKSKPLFTFPAISLSFSNKNNTSVVHSCIRTYNRGEKIAEESLANPQTGFDVDFHKKNLNYICFFGGYKKNYHLSIELLENDVLKVYNLKLENNIYGKSHIIYLEDVISNDDKKLFDNPKCSISHDLDDVFPRFYVGIINSRFIPTLTHTFFDTSNKVNLIKNKQEERFRVKNTNPFKYLDSSFSIPIFPINKFSTSLKSYAQNLEIKGNAFISVYSLNGQTLFNRKLSELELNVLSNIGDFDLIKIINEANLLISSPYSLKLSFVNEEVPFPKRFKLGLNVKRNAVRRGSNICFAPKVITESSLSKPFNRRWFPLGGTQKFIGTIHNTSFLRNEIYKKTNYKLEFINHEGEIFNKEFDLNQNESIFLDPSNDQELTKFLGNKGGWCMTKADTFFFDAYYFSMSNQLIGGDHAY